jgi:hypothetical protein
MRGTGLRIATANDPNYGLGVLDGRPAGRSADVPLAVIPPLDTPRRSIGCLDESDRRPAGSSSPHGAIAEHGVAVGDLSARAHSARVGEHCGDLVKGR